MKDASLTQELNLGNWFIRNCYAPSPGAVVCFMVPVFAAFLALGMRSSPPAAALGAWLGAGILTWTFLEYVIHRFFFHWATSSRAMRAFLARAHLLHHRYPNDTRILNSGPLFVIPVALFFFGLFSLGLGVANAALLMAGVSVGFTFYEWVHYHAHASSPRTRWMKALKKHHLTHHHQAWGACFGVTSPAWDHVLASTFKPKPRARTQDRRAG